MILQPKNILILALLISVVLIITKQHFESVSNMVENFYFKRDSKERIKQRTNDLRKNIHTKLNRLYSKLNNLNEDLKGDIMLKIQTLWRIDYR